VCRKKSVFILLLILFSSLDGHRCPAQENDTINDTLVIKKTNPRTATLCSALLPGLGQVYNGNYWKIPLIYGAGGALVYSFQYNNSKYQLYRNAFNEGDENSTYIIDGYERSYEQLSMYRDYYRRYRDLSLFGCIAVYLLNIVDAMVDAYFTDFDVSDDLTMHIEPVVVDNFDLAATFGLRIRIGF
jgi:TM2 domain-containing membrane protein YozV